MNASRTRSVPTARAVALAVTLLAMLGLGYVGVRSGADPVSIPEGARAGDLRLEPCRFATEHGSQVADCGTLVVPENRKDPQSRLIALPVTRIRAQATDPGPPVFHLDGGPGRTNMRFPQADRLIGSHDVVLVGYRGVDGSSVLDCPEVNAALRHSSGFLDEASFQAYARAFRDCARRLDADGVDLAGYTLAERADDLEAARAALGYERINLLGESAGTRTALIYSWRHPERVSRSVLVGANPPGRFLWDGRTTDAQIRHYAELCAGDEACRQRTDDLAAAMRRTAEALPDRWSLLPIDKGNARIGSFYGLAESMPEAGPLAAPATLDSWLAASEGDPSGLWLLSTMARAAFPDAFVWGDVAAASRADARAAERYFASGGRRTASVLGNAGTEFLFAGGAMLDAWPANGSEDDYVRVQPSAVETLLVGGTLDFATPAANATTDLLPHLSNGHQVVLAELGHTTDFWAYRPDAGTRLITTFLDRGTVDDSLYSRRAMDFTPAVKHGDVAKIAVGALTGLALLAALSLPLMARRVRRRGAFSRVSSGYLRSAHAAVLGVGGWCAGVLLVLTALPTVPIDGPVLTATAVGAPVGLGVYLAWANRGRTSRSNALGFAAATGAALTGAWLGVGAAPGFLAVLTAIAAAVAGANLMLLVLDTAWDRQRGDRPVVDRATPAHPLPRSRDPRRVQETARDGG